MARSCASIYSGGFGKPDNVDDLCSVSSEQTASTTDGFSSSDESSPSERCCYRKSTVTFSTVDVYYHNVILGDNPAVTFGPPLSLGWSVVGQESTVSVDHYEHTNKRRKTRQQMLIPGYRRKQLLTQAGYSAYAIEQAREEAEDVRLSRKANAKRLLSRKQLRRVERMLVRLWDEWKNHLLGFFFLVCWWSGQ